MNSEYKFVYNLFVYHNLFFINCYILYFFLFMDLFALGPGSISTHPRQKYLLSSKILDTETGYLYFKN